MQNKPPFIVKLHNICCSCFGFRFVIKCMFSFFFFVLVPRCPAVMGELLPSLGYYYWETEVSRCKAYRIGVAYQTVSLTSTLGENRASWCLHCVPTSIRYTIHVMCFIIPKKIRYKGHFKQ